MHSVSDTVSAQRSPAIPVASDKVLERPCVHAFRRERQSDWLDGIDGAFQHFDGVTEEVLVDNARALVTQHDAVTREVRFNCRIVGYGGFYSRPCVPYRWRTKEKGECRVGYVKRNTITGPRFEFGTEIEAHLAR